MQGLEVSGAIRPLQGSLGVKGLIFLVNSIYRDTALLLYLRIETCRGDKEEKSVNVKYGVLVG